MHRAALLLVVCACLGAQSAAIEGVVVNQTTGRPMPGVHVSFLSGIPSGDVQSYGAISDGKGHFSITSLPAGTYLAAAQARGFVYMPPDGKTPARRVSLKAGQQIADFKIEMAPEATISGRVFDDNGDPVQASVHTESAAERGMNVNAGDNSDERGEFQIAVAPGKYFIVAEQPSRVNMQVPEIRTDGTAPAVYAKTYYPASAAKARAAVVEATAGGDLAGIDIHLAREGRAFSIAGMVTGATQATAYATGVTLQQVEDFTHIRSANYTSAGPDGHFLFANLQPGTYRLLGLQRGDKTRLFSQPVNVDLEGSDVTGLNLVLGPGGELHGKLETVGGAGAERFSVGLELLPHGYFGDPSPFAEVDQGAFHIADIAPGHYRLKLTPMPENAYLKSVRLNDEETPENDLDLTRPAPASSLKIVVSRNGGQLSGKLLDQNGEPLGATPAAVLLVADPKKIDLERSFKVVEDGTYRFAGVRPGKYKLLAIDTEQLGWGDDYLERIEKLLAAAEEIEIKEGDRKVKDLKLTAPEGADAKTNQ